MALQRSKCALPLKFYCRPVVLNFIKICVSCYIRYNLQTDRLNLSINSLFYSVGIQTEGHINFAVIMFNEQLSRAGKNMPVDPNSTMCSIHVQQKLKSAERKNHKNEL